MTPAHEVSERGLSNAVLWWLATVAGLIVLIVLVGGATRLTDSGLSITEWKPILGVVPPLNDACLLYTSPSPRDLSTSRMPSSA